jgi:hypothetical protein
LFAIRLLPTFFGAWPGWRDMPAVPISDTV